MFAFRDLRTLSWSRLLVVGLAVGGGCDADGTWIGPEGGIVDSADGDLTLHIPPQALTEPVAIAIARTSDDNADDAIANAMKSFALEPYGLVFERPARLHVELAPAVAVDQPESAVTDKLALVTERDDEWVKLADHDVDSTDGTISASVLYLSRYAVVSTP